MISNANTIIFSWTTIIVCYFLITTSIKDIKTNEINNKVWLDMLFVLSPIILFEIYLNNWYFIIILKSFTASCFLLFILYKIRVFGGADVKLLMVLSILYPLNMFLIPIVTFISLIASMPVGLIKMKKEGRLDGNVVIPFIPIISIVFIVCLFTTRYLI